MTQLTRLEARLLQHDPSFTPVHTLSAIIAQRSALLNAFRPLAEEGDIAGLHRLHLNVERWRVPEVWFGPSMAGVDCAGLGEVIEGVLKMFGAAERDRLVRVSGLPIQLLLTCHLSHPLECLRHRRTVSSSKPAGAFTFDHPTGPPSRYTNHSESSKRPTARCLARNGRFLADRRVWKGQRFKSRI
jgi:hypothetical protein